MSIANVEMAQAWDGSEGDEWTEDADHYEGALPGTWNRFLELVPVKPTDRILDIGCGTGKSSRSLGALVTEGSVLGVDLSSRMLEEARRRAKAQGLTNVEFVQADAQVHPFDPGAFDLAVSSFGAMFFNDPVAAFTNIGDALRSGEGRLAVLAWQGLAENEWLRAYLGALDAGRGLTGPPVGAPGPFGLAAPDDVRRILGAAGFTGVELTSIEEPMYVGADLEDAWGFTSRLGVVKGLTQDLDEGARRQALADLRQVIADHVSADGVLLGTAAWLITATRA